MNQTICPIMGVNIQVTDMKKTVRALEENLEQWRGEYVCVANVHTTVTAHREPDYLAVQNGAVLILPDGSPLSAYARRHGFPQAKRVAGPDLMQEMLRRSGETGSRHFFYGGKQETLDKLAKHIPKQYPGAVVAGMYSPPFRPLTAQEEAECVERINAAKPDYVWVCLGAPKQERWMAAHKGKINGVMLGVGAAFEFEIGSIRRAPHWMQENSLEWLYRLVQDPKRLFKRYVSTNIEFLLWSLRH